MEPIAEDHSMEKSETSEVDSIYPLPQINYLKFNTSIIKGEHLDLPNPYYRQQLEAERELNDYTHLSENTVRRIIDKYGSFNRLSEEKIQNILDGNAQVGTQLNRGDGLMDDGSKFEDFNAFNDISEDVKNDQSLIDVNVRREELLNNVRTALGSSTLALDFVSLLLSGAKPNAGLSSLSDHIKQNLKAGSLSADKVSLDVADPQEHEQQKESESMKIGSGWKLESLKKSSELLKETVKNLNKSLDERHTYWNEVLEVLEANEVITAVTTQVAVEPGRSSSSLPLSSSLKTNQNGEVKQKKVLAVKYGYGDSGSEYFDKGIAILKQGEEGHLEFEKLNQNEREKTWGGEKIVSVKLFRYAQAPNEQPELVGQSDSYGLVTFRIHVIGSSRIQIELYDTIIQIDSLDIDSEELQKPTPKLSQNQRADNMVKLFRILLCANNYKNVQKLFTPRVALNKDQNVMKSRHGFLLRPLLMYTKHNHTIHKLEKLLFDLLLEIGMDEVDAKATFTNNMTIKKYVNDPNQLQQFQNSKRCYNNDPFLRVSSKLAPISMLILKVRGLLICIKLESSYTTLHITMNVKVTKVEDKQILLESTFNSKRDTIKCLSWILQQSGI
ncbi:unnamed protein product [Pichia kudriavzevii]